MAKLNWLEKVKADAERITLRRIKEYQEENDLEPAKEAEVEVKEETQEEIIEKPKTKARKDK
jgi:hypothetical protein